MVNWSSLVSFLLGDLNLNFVVSFFGFIYERCAPLVLCFSRVSKRKNF